MGEVFDTLVSYLLDTGFAHMHWSNAVMLAVGCLFIYLAIRKKFEPLLLLPIGFGMLIGNVPYDAGKLNLGVYDGPVSEADLGYYDVGPISSIEDSMIVPQVTGFDADAPLFMTDRELLHAVRQGGFLLGPDAQLRHIEDEAEARRLYVTGRAVMINEHHRLSPRGEVTGPGVYFAGEGRYVLVDDDGTTGRYPEVWSDANQDPHNASVFWWLFAGVGLAGFYPPLIFLGIGALTDFGPMLANPKTLLLGAAAQFGIFGSLLGALALGFTLQEAASIGIIGGADGPTAIFTCSQLAPDLLGAVALAAYSYMAMVPIIQPPIVKLLTSPEERRIRMVERKPVPKLVRIVFPVAGFLLTAMIAPGGLPLLGMLFFGNLLRESLVTERLAKTAQTTFIDIVTILLGVTVGAKTAAASFLTLETIYIFLLGITAFAVATATGVLFGKIMNALSKDPINPMIGAAGVSAVPMSARVVHKLGQQADPQNFLLMHAMGPNVAGVIGSAVAAGVLLSRLGGAG
ncbi:MAG: sodium ion-translocating decarboxylase subunit beta [Planctomycetota bacterium]